MSEIKQIAEQVVTNPKFAWLAVAGANISEWYVEWGSPVVAALTSVVGLGVMCLLLRYHWINTKKIKLDIKAHTTESEQIAELKAQIKAISDRKDLE